MNNKKRAIFLDRDGVINIEVEYLSDPKNFEFIEGSVEALRILKQKGFILIIITNQAGIARGYYTKEALNEIHKKMNRLLKEQDVVLDDIFYCPHHPDFTEECECRKPKPGMIFKARDKYNINLKKSYMVGDTLKDIEAGHKAQCFTVLVLTGYGIEERNKIGTIQPDFVYKTLLEFAKNL
ncbi:MAG: D-glycero-beta-D-manno-heptose 1,7-bisphosphate 7-phosphatase [Candidatus Lokiarchaeota archaeon]|nr:D-glycero-beta-D-manno-heptose 1,7-bisphosphate 7-phosphatase [Candidatus Lokiarchaeota archaeon]